MNWPKVERFLEWMVDCMIIGIHARFGMMPDELKRQREQRK